jgi:hypothetical protein
MSNQIYSLNEDGVKGYIGDDILTIGNGSWDNIHPDNIQIDLDLEEKVNHPSHYTQGSVECIEALEAATSNLTGIDAVCTANAIKYMWRWKQKGGLQDLKKAKWYIERLITRWENHETIY